MRVFTKEQEARLREWQDGFSKGLQVGHLMQQEGMRWINDPDPPYDDEHEVYTVLIKLPKSQVVALQSFNNPRDIDPDGTISCLIDIAQKNDWYGW